VGIYVHKMRLCIVSHICCLYQAVPKATYKIRALNISEFDVHGSVLLGNEYVQLKVQLDVHVFICILYFSLFLALHVSGAICTDPQEHKLQRTAICVCVIVLVC
jgi:hypothetical protein